MKAAIGELCLCEMPYLRAGVMHWLQECCPSPAWPCGQEHCSSGAPSVNWRSSGGDVHANRRQNCRFALPRLLEGSASQQWPSHCSQGAAALRYCPLFTAHSWPSRDSQGKKVLPAAERVGSLASHHLTLLRAAQRRKCSLHTAWNNDPVPR